MERGFAIAGGSQQASSTGSPLFGIPNGRAAAKRTFRIKKSVFTNRKATHDRVVAALDREEGMNSIATIVRETPLEHQEHVITAPSLPLNNSSGKKDTAQSSDGGSTAMAKAQAVMVAPPGHAPSQDVHRGEGGATSMSRLSEANSNRSKDFSSLGIGAASMWKSGMVRPTMTMEQLCAAVGRDLSTVRIATMQLIAQRHVMVKVYGFVNICMFCLYIV
jgi:hypothetical protein